MAARASGRDFFYLFIYATLYQKMENFKTNHPQPQHLHKLVMFQLPFQAYHFYSALVITHILFSVVL